MTTDITDILSRLRPDDAAHTHQLFPEQRRDDLLRNILGTEPSPGASRRRSRGRGARGLRPMRTRSRRALLLPGLAGLTAVAIAVALFSGGAVSPQPATAAVMFRSPPGDDIIATVTNPFVAAKELNADFAAHGFHITVTLIAASPSVVGTAAFIGDDGGPYGIEPLQSGPCRTSKCPVGVRIPKGFTGHGSIGLGRPAKPGEQYETAGQVTSPGEAMHGMEYIGRPISTMLRLLRARHVTVPQYRYQHDNYSHALRAAQVPGDWIVTGASPWALNQVLLFVAPPANRH